MMNKNKSGLPAKLKATLVAPFAILIFFLFADFTLSGSGRVAPGPTLDLQGLWIGQTEDNFSKSLLIKGDRFSYTEGVEIRDYNLRIKKEELMLSSAPGRSETALQFELKGDQLTLWWNDDQSSSYKRTKAENTLDHLLWESGIHLNLPYISQYRLLEDEDLNYRISMGLKDGGKIQLAFDGRPIELSALADLVAKERDKLNKMDQSLLTAIFLVDQQFPMGEVHKVRMELRKMNALHFAEGGYPQGDLDLSPLIYQAVALPRLLPPVNAKTLDKKEMEKLGGKLHTIDLSAQNTTPRDMDDGLRDFIRSNDDGKYVISLQYDETIPYGQYVETVDLVWKTVYSFRNALAMERHSVPYNMLGDDLQREIRKAYPMALSETMN